eukprot:454836-Prymnesium_polylepis.1
MEELRGQRARRRAAEASQLSKALLILASDEGAPVRRQRQPDGWRQVAQVWREREHGAADVAGQEHR